MACTASEHRLIAVSPSCFWAEFHCSSGLLKSTRHLSEWTKSAQATSHHQLLTSTFAPDVTNCLVCCAVIPSGQRRLLPTGGQKIRSHLPGKFACFQTRQVVTMSRDSNMSQLLNGGNPSRLLWSELLVMQDKLKADMRYLDPNKGCFIKISWGPSYLATPWSWLLTRPFGLTYAWADICACVDHHLPAHTNYFVCSAVSPSRLPPNGISGISRKSRKSRTLRAGSRVACSHRQTRAIP